MSSVVVVDSGVANIGSVVAALERLAAQPVISADWSVIRAAERVLLPGVGAAAAAMRELDRRGLVERLRELTQPVLGVCLGMQLMFEASEEGAEAPALTPCLGLLPGIVRRLPESPGVRVPHMGWNALLPRRAHPLVAGLGAQDYAYFVHSYAVAESPLTLMACEHGQAFSAIVAQRNFMGAQCHPERSAQVGARLLSNFLTLDPESL
ncbi:MAG: imidazole glycerol phosphate synthase subunit HisH [Lysobacterales bacterium]